MNNVSIIGRLTGDPELRTTQSGKSMTRFTVAVDRPVKSGEEKQADFINIVAWNQTAEFICKYFTKGQRIALTGSIRTGSYTDRDGEKRYTFDVVTNNVEFCESKAKKAETERPNANNDTKFEQKPEIYDVPDNSDLPF